MKRLFFLTLILGLIFSVNGQSIDKRIQKQISFLKLSSIDTFLIYSLACNGGLPSLDTCSYDTPHYLFWVHHENWFIKKFDCCQNYRIIQLDTKNPLSFYLTYKNQIEKEEIKAPSYLQSEKGHIIMTSMIDHDCFYKMIFQVNRDSIIKKVSDYNLNFKYFDKGKKNRYYDYHQKTKLKALIGQITKLVEQLNVNGKYIIE